MSIDMSSLIDEMDALSSYDIPSTRPSHSEGADSKSDYDQPDDADMLYASLNTYVAGKENTATTKVQRGGSVRSSETVASQLKKRDAKPYAMSNKDRGKPASTKRTAAGKKKPFKLKKTHKTHGDCPFDVMAEFLVAVSAQNYTEALNVSAKILKYEPDNPLIAMYVESLEELLKQQREEERNKAFSQHAEEEESTDGDDDGYSSGSSSSSTTTTSASTSMAEDKDYGGSAAKSIDARGGGASGESASKQAAEDKHPFGYAEREEELMRWPRSDRK